MRATCHVLETFERAAEFPEDVRLFHVPAHRALLASIIAPNHERGDDAKPGHAHVNPGYDDR